MAPHQERVVVEKTELDNKLTKLNSFFSTDVFAGVAPAEQDRLKKQAGIMLQYSEVLGERIANFS
jgi:hypothetical protein